MESEWTTVHRIIPSPVLAYDVCSDFTQTGLRLDSDSDIPFGREYLPKKVLVKSEWSLRTVHRVHGVHKDSNRNMWGTVKTSLHQMTYLVVCLCDCT
jgi:hypothetical protein